jgi:hypothetical protein
MRIGPPSAGELARKDAELEELRAAKRQLEPKNTALRSEIEELHKPASASRCEICHDKQRAVLRRVFVCNDCAYIHELETAVDAAPPDDDLDIPTSLAEGAAMTILHTMLLLCVVGAVND